MTEPQQTAEKHSHFRKIYKEATGEAARATRDRYAKFMAERFPNAAENYAQEWAQRFYTGTHWHKMDRESRRAMLKALTESYDTTASELDARDIKEVAAELVNTAEQCPACDLGVTEYEPTVNGHCPMCGRKVTEK